MSGLCIRTISSHLGEVTSVEMNSSGTLLLSSSKDNSNRLWDVRMVRPIRKLKGHQNTSKNFVRANFADNNLISGGSEDGVVYIWDQATGEVLQKLRGHTGVVYDAAWNARQGMFASCSDDQTVKVWWYDESVSSTLFIISLNLLCYYNRSHLIFNCFSLNQMYKKKALSIIIT